MDKIVLFKGTKYSVPDWTNYIAVDKPNGDIYAFMYEPTKEDDGVWIAAEQPKYIGNIDCVKIVGEL